MTHPFIISCQCQVKKVLFRAQIFDNKFFKSPKIRFLLDGLCVLAIKITQKQIITCCLKIFAKFGLIMFTRPYRRIETHCDLREISCSKSISFNSHVSLQFRNSGFSGVESKTNFFKRFLLGTETLLIRNEYFFH